MPTTAEAQEPMSFEAFHAFLNTRPDIERWELIDGQPVMMVNVTWAHSTITGNFYSALRDPARRRGCEVHASDFFASGGELSGFLAAPDVFVRCGPIDDRARRADDPVVVVEVLSPSTIRHDRVRKFERYTRIASLGQIVLVYQDEVRVESFLRDGGNWPMEAFTSLAQAVPVPALDTAVGLAEIYERTALGRTA